ncbi:MAG: peptide chain release factor N(5)-glutamine methyltransferase [Acidobacteriota bacterium]
MSTTFGELVKEGARMLAAGKVEMPHRTAKYLMQELLDVEAATLIAYPERIVSDADAARVRQAFYRRASGEPLQYITGRQYFYGRDFQVTPDVLIPRPETELLVEASLEYVRACPRSRWRLLDLGTGSGCLAVTLAMEIPAAQVVAVDISSSALAVAMANAQRHGVAERICFVESHWLDAVPAGPPFDLVVSNPPYVAEEAWTGLQREVRDHEPYLALVGGKRGTEAYAHLLATLPPYLADGGKFLCEVGFDQASQVCALGEARGWKVERVIYDLQGIARTLVFCVFIDSQ